jgi:ABC-2 type transport system permease protein
MKLNLIASDIYWVFWREMKKFLQQKIRIVMTIVQPLVWLVLMGNTMSGLTNNPVAAKMLGTGNYISFMAPGIMIMTSLFGGVFGGTSIIWDRRLGFLNKMLTAPIHRASIPIGKLLALGTQIIFQALIIVVISLILGVHFVTGPLGIICMLLLSSLFGIIMGGISLSIAAVLTSMESLFAITNFLTMPLIFTSNAMFPLSAMPVWLRVIARFNPLTYAAGTMRTIATKGWIGSEIWPGLIALLILVMITTTISIRMFKRSIS